MKNEKTYRRFNGIAFLAGAGCLAVILFEAVFIFELYDELPAMTERIPFLRTDRNAVPSEPVKKELPAQPVAPPVPSEEKPAEVVPVG